MGSLGIALLFKMVKVIIDGVVIMESSDTKRIEGNHYFPPSAKKPVDGVTWKTSTLHTTCPWKGQASYWSITVNGENHDNCVWAYPNTKDGPAKEFEGYFAFYRRGGVEIVE